MAYDPIVSFRCPRALITRLDLFAKECEVTGMKVSRADVIRAACVQFLKQADEQTGTE